MIRKLATALSVVAGIVALSATPAQAAGTQAYVTTRSQTDIWIDHSNGVQSMLRRGAPSESYVTAAWTGPGYCTAFRYSDGTVQYGYPSTWAGLSSLHGFVQMESWKGCWG